MAVSPVASSASLDLQPQNPPPLSSSEPIDAQPLLPVIVRAAQAADLPALMDMKRQMAVEEDAAGYFDEITEHWQRDFFGAAPRVFAIVAECIGVPIGMAIFNEHPIAGWPVSPIYVQSVFVRPTCRHHGIGRALMAAITAEALRRGTHLIYLNVRQDNAARRLYERGGFVHADSCLVYTLLLPQFIGAAGAGAERNAQAR